MAKIKVTSPKVEEVLIVVSIPLEKPILVLGYSTIGDAESLFSYARNKESNNKIKI